MAGTSAPAAVPAEGADAVAVTKSRAARKAIVAVGRSVPVAVWHLLADPTARFHDLGPDHYDAHVNTNRRVRNHVRELQALGHTVTLTPAA